MDDIGGQLPSFQKRTLLFSNDAAAGIFRVHETYLYVILSTNAEFVHIAKGDSAQVHLTRFVPTEHAKRVEELLNFRNRFVRRPYICTRFHKTEEYYGDGHIRLHRGEGQLYSSRDGTQNSITYGAHGHAVCTELSYLCKEENVTGKSSEFSPRRCLTISQLLPVSWLASEPFISILQQVAHECDNGIRSIPIPEAELCGARSSAEALELFQALAPEMTLFLESTFYPRQFRVITECLDDETIYLSTTRLGESEVECWILTSPLLLVPIAKPLEVSSALVLSKETIDVHWTGSDGTSLHYTAHISLLDVDATFSDEEALKDEGNAAIRLPVLLGYSNYAARLIIFRDSLITGYQQLTASTAPSSSSRRPLSEIETMRDVHTRESDGARFTALYDGRVRSVFSDRTILEVRPHERFVRALLPDGECAFYDLQKCMDIASAALSAENTFCPLVEPSEMPKYTKFLDNECLLGHYMSPGKITTTIHTLGYSSGADTPSLIVAEQVQSLLAFKRWSDTPREKRDAEEDRIRKLLKASTTEYQKASRYLITAAMKNGKISLDEAAYLSDCQRAALGTVGRKTALMDIQNHTYTKEGSVACLGDSKSTYDCVPSMSRNGSFEVCLKADDIMKKTEIFLRKMQMDSLLKKI